jgi:multiple sugar transport system substrate-binding protein
MEIRISSNKGEKKMKRTRQMLSVCLILMTTLGFLSAGGARETTGAKAGEPITITHWFWPDSDMHIATMQSMVEDFNATNGKNIKVNLEVHPWDGGQYSEDLFNVAMGGGAPDTAGFKLTSTPLFVANNLLEPLDSYIEKWEGKDEIEDSLYTTLKNVTNDGKLYLMPWNIQVLYVYYRPSIFKKAGIGVPETYEEFLEAIKKTTLDTNGDGKTDVYGYGLRGSKGGQEPWGSFIYARGGSFEDMTSPGAIKGMEDFINIYKNGYAPPSAPNDGFTQIIANFQSGLTAMTIQHIGSSKNMIDTFGDDVDAFQIPPSKEGSRWTSMGDTETVMFADSKNKDAAFEWIAYLANGKGQETWCVTTGNVPVSQRVRALPAIDENRFMKVSVEGAPFADIIPVRETTTDWINNIWPGTIQRALLGQITSTEAMTILQKGLYD